jgi:hypothetical protein
MIATGALLSTPEIAARLLEIHTARKTFDVEEAELLARLQKPKNDTVKPARLTFGKNIIAWGNGKALAIKGKGYLLVKVLYEADEMQLSIADLEKFVWQVKDNNEDKTVKQNTFLVCLRRLSEKLEKAKFPYRLLPTRSQERIENNGEIWKDKSGIEKPGRKRFRSEITGAKLCMTVNCKNVMLD